jgi:hypothetical protein
MVDVARSASSHSHPLFDTQTSFSDLASSSSNYWTDQTSHKGRASQDSYSSDSRAHLQANPFSGIQTITSRNTFANQGPLPEDNMSSSGGYSASENSRHGGGPSVPAMGGLRQQHTATNPQSRPMADRQESANGGLFVVQHQADKPDFLTPEDSNVRNSGNGIVSYLQLPSTITESNGSLAEFAAQVRGSIFVSRDSPNLLYSPR